MERKLTAILSADVEGYSRLMGEDEEATIRTLTSYRQLMMTAIGARQGRRAVAFAGAARSGVAIRDIAFKSTVAIDSTTLAYVTFDGAFLMSSESPPILFEYPSPEALAGDRSWWEIYDEAFPANEREPRHVILNSLRKRVGVAVQARQGEQTIGLATVHLLRKPAAVFLVYLAIARHLRGRSLGGLLLEHAWQIGASRLSEQGLTAIGLVWEVDITALAETGDEEHKRERRIAFFHRQGGYILPRPYSQPPVHGIAPVPMRLMYRPAKGTGLPDPAATEALAQAIYFEKYGAVNGVTTETLDRLLKASE